MILSLKFRDSVGNPTDALAVRPVPLESDAYCLNLELTPESGDDVLLLGMFASILRGRGSTRGRLLEIVKAMADADEAKKKGAGT